MRSARAFKLFIHLPDRVRGKIEGAKVEGRRGEQAALHLRERLALLDATLYSSLQPTEKSLEGGQVFLRAGFPVAGHEDVCVPFFKLSQSRDPARDVSRTYLRHVAVNVKVAQKKRLILRKVNHRVATILPWWPTVHTHDADLLAPQMKSCFARESLSGQGEVNPAHANRKLRVKRHSMAERQLIRLHLRFRRGGRDDNRVLLGEDFVAEHLVGLRAQVNDEADGKAGALPDLIKNLARVKRIVGGIDHHHALIRDDEAHVYGAVEVRVAVLIHDILGNPNKRVRRDLLHFVIALGGTRRPQREKADRGEKRQPRREMPLGSRMRILRV